MKKSLFLVSLLCSLVAGAAEISVALYPYVPDLDAYKKALVAEWAKAGESDTLEFVDWDCYDAAYPTNIDVTVYDGQFLARYVKGGRLLEAEALSSAAAKNFPDWSVKGGAIGGTVYGLPQMLCTHFTFRRRGETGAPAARACENDLGAKHPDLAPAGWQVFGYEDPMDLRAAWFAAATNRVLVDYSETMKKMPRALRDTLDYAPFAATNAPYYVDYASVSTSCPEAKRAAARRLVQLLVSRDYLEAALWPQGEEPQYILPARIDVFTSFAARDPIYGKLLGFALRPDNVIMKSAEETK